MYFSVRPVVVVYRILHRIGTPLQFTTKLNFILPRRSRVFLACSSKHVIALQAFLQLRLYPKKFT